MAGSWLAERMNACRTRAMTLAFGQAPAEQLPQELAPRPGRLPDRLLLLPLECLVLRDRPGRLGRLELAGALLGVAGGLGAGRAGVAVAAHHHDVALIGGVSVGVEGEAPVAAHLRETLGRRVAVVLDHGHAALGELGDDLGPLGLALGPQQGVAHGPGDVVELVIDDGPGRLGRLLRGRGLGGVQLHGG